MTRHDPLGSERSSHELVDALCRRGVRDARVDGAGVTLRAEEGPGVVLCATDERAEAVERLQLTLGEGPCLDATTSGVPVLISDLRDPAEGTAGRWPAFMAESDVIGVRAVFAFPLRVGAIRLGVMDLYRVRPGPLDATELRTTLRTADAIGSALLSVDPHAHMDELAAERFVVHQAAGMVMVQSGTSIEEALSLLRARAYATGTPLDELGAQVVRGELRFEKERP